MSLPAKVKIYNSCMALPKEAHLKGVRVHALLRDGEHAAGDVREAVGDVPSNRGLALVIQHHLRDVPGRTPR